MLLLISHLVFKTDGLCVEPILSQGGNRHIRQILTPVVTVVHKQSGLYLLSSINVQQAGDVIGTLRHRILLQV